MISREFEYSVELYEALERESRVRTIQGIEVTAWEGSLVNKYRGLGISQTYYSPVKGILEGQGCITTMRRGSRSAPSLIVLHHPPDEAEYTILKFGGPKDLTEARYRAKLRTMIREELKDQIGGRDIVETLRELDTRVSAIERKIQPNTGEK